MTARKNRRDVILDAASQLFVEHGYAATSVRQIAEAVGVTEAALYYHFKEGKRALLQAVIEEHSPDMTNVLKECHEATSLHDLAQKFGRAMAEMGRRKLQRYQWIFRESTRFTEDECAFVHAKQLMFHDGLADLIEQFVPDAERASALAWLMILMAYGYGQLFLAPHLRGEARQMGEEVDLEEDVLIDVFADTIAYGALADSPSS